MITNLTIYLFTHLCTHLFTESEKYLLFFPHSYYCVTLLTGRWGGLGRCDNPNWVLACLNKHNKKRPVGWSGPYKGLVVLGNGFSKMTIYRGNPGYPHTLTCEKKMWSYSCDQSCDRSSDQILVLDISLVLALTSNFFRVSGSNFRNVLLSPS